MHPGITVEKLIDTNEPGVRVVVDKSTQTLYYNSFVGNVYRIEQPEGGAPYQVHIASASDHGINYLQGMAFSGSTLVLVGNYKQAQQQGYGLVVKGTQQANGNWQWTRVMQTASYPSSATLYDHAFSSVVVSPGGDSVYVASGSRTDHGEVEDTDGLYPNTRETALTATIFKFPLNASSTIILPNDSTAVYASGYVFCRGVRNEFDMALNAEGRLFGVENSGDRDDPEEMNWLRAGHHYGFPWEMGGNQTPMQFPGYDGTQDKLVPSNLSDFQRNRFYNDPGFPRKPPGLIITQPIQNTGSDANWARNPATGAWERKETLNTFTAHRSPLGLVIDKDSLLADFMGGSFVLAYSAGGGLRGGYMPAEDPGEDLSFVRLTYSPTLQNYTATVTRVADQFNSPTDAELVGNTLYVIEEGRRAIWRLRLRPALTDVSLSGRLSALVTGVTAPLTVTLTATNAGPQRASQVVVQNRLPTSVQYVPGGVMREQNGVLTSPAVGIDPSQSVSWTYQVRPTGAGTYLNAAQIMSQLQPDSDSQPGSGTGDGQDDAVQLMFKTQPESSAVFQSPNPAQTPLPPVASSQPLAPANQADLSLSLVVDRRTAPVGGLLTYSVVVSNRGGRDATDVNVQVALPTALMGEAGGSIPAAGTLSGVISVAAGGSVTLTMRVRTGATGTQTVKAQILTAAPADPDSTPGNGYENGEDDAAQCEVRVL